MKVNVVNLRFNEAAGNCTGLKHEYKVQDSQHDLSCLAVSFDIYLQHRKWFYFSHKLACNHVFTLSYHYILLMECDNWSRCRDALKKQRCKTILFLSV